MEETYIRRGFGLRSQLQPLIDLEYQSALVQGIRSEGHRRVFGDITVRLAQEFGFCYGVDRQDAIETMMDEGPPAVMIVIGGYNSSNTDHLAHLCRQFTTTYHIEDAACIDLENGTIRHKPDVGSDTPEDVVADWLPEGLFDLGMTAGASTPNNKIGEALLRILEIRGVEHAIP